MKLHCNYLIKLRLNSVQISIAIFAMLTSFIIAGYAEDTAKSWFEKGLTAADGNLKKQFFIKAIEIDSNYVEAYYRLGEALVSSNQIQLAENVYKLGLTKAQENADAIHEAQILIELAAMARNQRLFESAQTYLLQAEKLPLSAELQAVVKYDQGTLCMFQSQFTEAARYFEAGGKLAPQLKQKFASALALARSEGKIEIWYREAESFFELQQWNQALELYQKVASVSANYKDVDLKMRVINQKFQPVKNEVKLDEIYAQGITHLLKKDYQNAIEAFEKIIKIAPNFKDVQEKLQAAQANVTPQPKTKNLDEIYQKGIDLFNQKKWDEALSCFKQVMVEDSNYQNVHQFVNRTEKNMKQQARPAAVENYEMMELETVEMTVPETPAEIDSLQEFRKFYLQGIQYAGQNRWTQALLAFEKAKAFYDSDSLNKRIDDAREKLRTKNQQPVAETQFAVVGSRSWHSYWLIGFMVLISVAVFLVTFRRYFKKSESSDGHD